MRASSSMRERVMQWHLAAMRRSFGAERASSRADALRIAREHDEVCARIARLRGRKEDTKAKLRAAASELDAARRRCAALRGDLCAECDALARQTRGAFFGRMAAGLAWTRSGAFGRTAAALCAQDFFGARCAEWNEAHATDGLAVAWPASAHDGEHDWLAVRCARAPGDARWRAPDAEGEHACDRATRVERDPRATTE